VVKRGEIGSKKGENEVPSELQEQVQSSVRNTCGGTRKCFGEPDPQVCWQAWNTLQSTCNSQPSLCALYRNGRGIAPLCAKEAVP